MLHKTDSLENVYIGTA